MKPEPSDERRQQITRAAATLFDTKGFHNTSMEDVAEAIGVRKPTLYHYVTSKAQLVLWIHNECVAAVLPPLRDYVASRMPASEVLYRVARDIFGLMHDKPGYMRVYFENHRDLDPDPKSSMKQQRDEYYNLVKQTMLRGNEEGELAVRDPDLSAMAFFGMCNWAYQWTKTDGRLSGEDIARYVWEDFMNGIKAPSQPDL